MHMCILISFLSIDDFVNALCVKVCVNKSVSAQKVHLFQQIFKKGFLNQSSGMITISYTYNGILFCVYVIYVTHTYVYISMYDTLAYICLKLIVKTVFVLLFNIALVLR